MAYRPKNVDLSGDSFSAPMASTPLDWARSFQTDRVENDLDGAILRNARTDHSPSRRPEVRGAQDTYGWNRYGGGDGDGPHSLVVGRSADSQNRRQR